MNLTIRGLARVLVLSVIGLLSLLLVGAWLAQGRLAGYAEDALTSLLKSKALSLSSHGATEVNLFTASQFSFTQLELRESGDDSAAPVATIDRVRVGIALLPLLWGEARVKTLHVAGPTMLVRQRPDGSFGLTLQRLAVGEAVGPFAVTIQNGAVRILDQAGGQLLRAQHCDFTSPALSIAGNDQRLPARLSFEGTLSCAELHQATLLIGDLTAAVVAQDGLYDSAIKARTLGNSLPDTAAPTAADPASTGSGGGRLKADFSRAQPQYHLQYRTTGFDVGPFLKGRGSEVLVQGQIDLDLELQITGNKVGQLKRTANGTLSIRGQELILKGIDLDRWLADIEQSQGFGVLDIGAVIFGGPFGLVLTQAYDFASLANKVPGQSGVQQLVSDWIIEDGVARARDVAFATEQHRLAVLGNINLAEERYEGLTVALITPQGCSILKQQIEGPIKQPTIESINVLQRVAAPVVKLLKDVKETLTQDDCEVIYDGALVHAQQSDTD